MQALCLAVKWQRGMEMRSLRRCNPGRWGPLCIGAALSPCLDPREGAEGLGDRSGNSTAWTLPLTCVNIKQTSLLVTSSFREARPSMESWRPWKHQEAPVDTSGRHWHPLLVQRTSEPSEGKKVLELKSVLLKDLKDSKRKRGFPCHLCSRGKK